MFRKLSIVEKFKKKYCIQLLVFAVMTIALFVSYRIYKRYSVEMFYEINYGMVPVMLIVFCYNYILRLPIVSRFLGYIGKHSMNIFFIHIFIRSNYACDFIYSFKNCFVVVFVLLVLSIFISIIIEFMKKMVKYNELYDKCVDILGKRMCKE